MSKAIKPATFTKADYFDFAKAFFGECLEISKKKNADYTAGPRRTHSPTSGAWRYLAFPREQGFLTRMMDKMKRIGSFVEHRAPFR
jgi:hypothetical protein